MIAIMIALSLAGAFLLSSIFSPIMKRAAGPLGMLDRPAGHKAHVGAVPLLGGSAVLLAFIIPAGLGVLLAILWQGGNMPSWIPAQLAEHFPGAYDVAYRGGIILAGAIGLHILGLVDDRRALGPGVKLVVQVVVCAVVVVFAEVRVMKFAGEALSIGLTILWLVTIVNAFNFMDNMDGLAGGVAVICATALLISSACMGQVFVSLWLGLIVGALLGFLPYNFPPAKMYLGDGGSLTIGYLLAVLSCLTTYSQVDGPGYLYGVFVPVIVMAVPLYDTASVIFIRLRAGDSPMAGDRRHFSHRLLKRGLGVRMAVITIYLCVIATAIGAMLLPLVRTVFAAVIIFIQTIAILALIALLESSGDA